MYWLNEMSWLQNWVFCVQDFLNVSSNKTSKVRAAELYVSKEKFIHQVLHTFLKEKSEGYNFELLEIQKLGNADLIAVL